MEIAASECYKSFCERVNFYKNFGYDIEKEREFIIEKAQPLHGDILEVGTGKGYFTVTLARLGYTFITIDISEEEQRIARSNITYLGLQRQVDFRIENAQNLSFTSKSFDIIFSVNTLHHLSNPFQMADELIRVISPEGKIILSDFNAEGLELVDRIHQSEGRRHTHNHFSLDKIMDYFEKKGLNTERYNSSFQDIGMACHQAE